jgi:hypothetical protein
LQKWKPPASSSSIKDFYWDIRPKPEYGTIELRVCDTPLTVDRAAALAAYLQALCRMLLQRDEAPPVEDDYLVYNYNRFQACRFGLDGVLVHPKSHDESAAAPGRPGHPRQASKEFSTPRSTTSRSKRRSIRARPFGAHRQPGAAQARGPAAGVLLQAARRLQQDGHLSPEKLKRGVICASAGNHAQGVALAAPAARLPGGDRHADDDAADQGRGGQASAAARWCWPASPTTTPTRTRWNSRRASG